MSGQVSAPAYQRYAPIYDATGQGRLSLPLAALARRYAQPPVGRVLDLGCGTGEAALAFARAGCQVVGVDSAPAMLAIAWAKARDARQPLTLLDGDMRDPPPQAAGPFDIVTCLGSLNELSAPGDLGLALGAAARALRPGGLLAFDLTAAHVYLSWDQRDEVVHDDAAHFVYRQLDYDRAHRLGAVRVVWFVRELERWWRDEEQHWQRAWDDAEVAMALDAAGLALRARLTPQGVPAGAEAPQVVYLAARDHA